jgi:two-component system, chemotaxis family, protein-glutamate methylesterase/glutaminase
VPHVPLVAVGASAGGVEALRALVAGLPEDLAAAVLVVLHIPRTGPSALPKILQRAGALPAAHAVDGEPLQPGRIYVAPADHHLLVFDGRARLSHGPAENGHRPAVDPLFRAAARAAGRRAIAVVLSGARDDGTAGATAVLNRGGRLVVQDPDDALHPSMPRSVLEHVGAGRVCRTAELGSAVAEAVRAAQNEPDEPSPEKAAEDLTALETSMADLDDMNIEDLPSRPAGLACPACNGALFELPGEPTPRYRCWVGHAWSPQSLLDEQAEAFEGALWMALRSLEEKISLSNRMAASADRRGSPGAASRYRQVGSEAEHSARLIRDLIGQLGTLNSPPLDAERPN